MLIIAEKPNVAKEFADALSCRKTGGIYSGKDTTITNCKGHLFNLEEPKHYTSEIFPIIPERFDYRANPNTSEQTKIVISLLKKHRNEEILIATDADREGEVIARECLLMAGITDFRRIKRFWVSQALTAEVIKDGIRNAKPLSEYNVLSAQGFARQHADWLVGMNFSRYISRAANTKLPVGRVQTAILSAISERCDAIKNFRSEKYFEQYGIFRPTRVGSGNTECTGIYFENNTTKFPDDSRSLKLKECVGKKAILKEKKEEEKSVEPPQLYNLNSAQKDAFKFFGYSANETLSIIQSLYDDLKCVSYPRTPSKVMGSGNTGLCQDVFNELCRAYPKYRQLAAIEDFSVSNKRCFNDKKLEAHHALIPLKALPENADEKQMNIYTLILERFMAAFLPESKYIQQVYILEVGGNTFKISGRKTTEPGWKKFTDILSDRHVSVQSKETESEEQSLDGIDWNSLVLSETETKEKWTKPPKYFNEASILSFMENPKPDQQVSVHNEQNEKLTGLGTPATRHTFIPKLTANGYIELQNKNFICTRLGETLLSALRNSSLKQVADISATTQWEKDLAENPETFEKKMKDFVRQAVSTEIKIDHIGITENEIKCPACGKPVKESAKNYFCTGYKDGCKFKSLWKETRGTKFTKSDIKALCEGKKTALKKCTKKDGGSYECRFILNKDNFWELEPLFEKRNKK